VYACVCVCVCVCVCECVCLRAVLTLRTKWSRAGPAAIFGEKWLQKHMHMHMHTCVCVCTYKKQCTCSVRQLKHMQETTA